VWGSILTLFSPGLVWLLIDLPFALWLTVVLTSTARPQVAAPARAIVALVGVAAVAAAGLLLSAPRLLSSIPLDQMFRDRAVAEQLSPLGYHAYDAWNYT